MGIKKIILLLLLSGLSHLNVFSQTDTAQVYIWRGREIKYLLIEKGRTIYNISKTYGIPEDTLIAINPALLDGLKAGMLLRIPLKLFLPLRSNVSPNNNVLTDTLSTQKKKSKPKTNNSEDEQCEEIERKQIHIGLFLPFNLSEKDEDSKKFSSAYDFYGGVKIALDSLEKKGILAKVHVYDVKTDTNRIKEILQSPEAKKLDLIIGPLYKTGFMPVAEFARDNGICAVSPFSQSRSILDLYPNVVKLWPDNATALKELCKKMMKSKTASKFFLVKNEDEKDQKIAETLVKTFSDFNVSLTLINFSENNQLKNSLDNTLENVFIFPSTTESSVIDFVSNLHSEKGQKSVTLVGLSEWTEYEEIELDFLEEMQFTYPVFVISDCEDSSYSPFCVRFKNEYYDDPGIYATQGFDVMYYFGGLASKYGKSFHKCLDKLPVYHGLGGSFHFTRKSKYNGLENDIVNVMQLDDFSPKQVYK